MRCWTFVLLTVIAVCTSAARQPRQISEFQPEFQTEPQRAVVSIGGSITLLANAGRPLHVCQYWLPGSTGRLVDLSKGKQSTSTDKYEYHGEGLDRGHCGIKLKRLDGADDGIVECKVLAVGRTQWLRSVTTLRVTDRSAQELPDFNIVPRTALLARGDNIDITCNTNRPITLCHIFLPGGKRLNMDRGPESESTNEYRYLGSGLHDGQCGTTLTGVNQQLTGYVVCKVGDWPDDLSGNWETAALKIETTYGVRPVTLRPPTVRPSTACPGLLAPTLQIECTFAGERVNCARTHLAGTIARLDCKPGYTKASSTIYDTITCTRGGEWDQPLFICIPDCGRRKTNRGAPLVSGGQDSQVGEFPWHVGFYEKYNGQYVQTCGGSLITPNLIVSAAHCFWIEQSSTKKPASLYKIGAGKHMREWTLISGRIQKRDVLEIKTHQLYRGRDSSYAYDIAVVRVTSPFTITPSVNLICVDWRNEFEDKQLEPGKFGIVTGWGYTENNTQSDTLRYVDLPYVSPTTCQGALDRELVRLLTNDKFCAGYTNRSTSACGGDSGGGLVFKHTDGKFYLRGIVSIAFTPAHIKEICYSQQYTGFTKVSHYYRFIRDSSI